MQARTLDNEWVCFDNIALIKHPYDINIPSPFLKVARCALIDYTILYLNGPLPGGLQLEAFLQCLGFDANKKQHWAEKTLSTLLNTFATSSSDYLSTFSIDAHFEAEIGSVFLSSRFLSNTAIINILERKKALMPDHANMFEHLSIQISLNKPGLLLEIKNRPDLSEQEKYQTLLSYLRDLNIKTSEVNFAPIILTLENFPIDEQSNTKVSNHNTTAKPNEIEQLLLELGIVPDDPDDTVAMQLVATDMSPVSTISTSDAGISLKDYLTQEEISDIFRLVEASPDGTNDRLSDSNSIVPMFPINSNQEQVAETHQTEQNLNHDNTNIAPPQITKKRKAKQVDAITMPYFYHDDEKNLPPFVAVQLNENDSYEELHNFYEKVRGRIRRHPDLQEVKDHVHFFIDQSTKIVFFYLDEKIPKLKPLPNLNKITSLVHFVNAPEPISQEIKNHFLRCFSQPNRHVRKRNSEAVKNKKSEMQKKPRPNKETGKSKSKHSSQKNDPLKNEYMKIRNTLLPGLPRFKRTFSNDWSYAEEVVLVWPYDSQDYLLAEKLTSRYFCATCLDNVIAIFLREPIPFDTMETIFQAIGFQPGNKNDCDLTIFADALDRVITKNRIYLPTSQVYFFLGIDGKDEIAIFSSKLLKPASIADLLNKIKRSFIMSDPHFDHLSIYFSRHLKSVCAKIDKTKLPNITFNYFLEKMNIKCLTHTNEQLPEKRPNHTQSYPYFFPSNFSSHSQQPRAIASTPSLPMPIPTPSSSHIITEENISLRPVCSMFQPYPLTTRTTEAHASKHVQTPMHPPIPSCK